MYYKESILQHYHSHLEFDHGEYEFYAEFLSSQKRALASIVKARSFTPTSLKLLQADPNIPSIEMNALQDFYKSTNGPHWVYSQQDMGIWNFTGLSIILFYPPIINVLWCSVKI